MRCETLYATAWRMPVRGGWGCGVGAGRRSDCGAGRPHPPTSNHLSINQPRSNQQHNAPGKRERNFWKGGERVFSLNTTSLMRFSLRSKESPLLVSSRPWWVMMRFAAVSIYVRGVWGWVSRVVQSAPLPPTQTHPLLPFRQDPKPRTGWKTSSSTSALLELLTRRATGCVECFPSWPPPRPPPNGAITLSSCLGLCRVCVAARSRRRARASFESRRSVLAPARSPKAPSAGPRQMRRACRSIGMCIKPV